MAYSTLSLTALIKRKLNLGLKVTGPVAGPVTLTPADNPLAIASTGTITSTGPNNDGVDGGAGAVWTIINQERFPRTAGGESNLAGAGILDNLGTLSGWLGGLEPQALDGHEFEGNQRRLGRRRLRFRRPARRRREGRQRKGRLHRWRHRVEGASGAIANDGAISKTAPRAYAAVQLDAGGSVTNNADGSILGAANGALGVNINNGLGVVTNKGKISGGAGVFLGAGGAITNAKGASISSDGRRASAVDIEGGAGVVTNAGTISGPYGSGVFLGAGGSVTNTKGAAILGSNRLGAGVEISNGLGVLSNAGEIDGGYGNGVVSTPAAASRTTWAPPSTPASSASAFRWRGRGTVTNRGAINGGQGGGVDLAAGGSVTNAKCGSISAGLRATGVDIAGRLRRGRQQRRDHRQRRRR